MFVEIICKKYVCGNYLQAIHKKILSLGFNDCHAKIRQVDSQSTVGDSVVVQVTGELSNNGEPMRRFMQTFVLVPQNPTKFYVHNDIFRYQDEVFHDEDGDFEDVDRKYLIHPSGLHVLFWRWEKLKDRLSEPNFTRFSFIFIEFSLFFLVLIFPSFY